MGAIPKAGSVGEEALALHLRAHGIQYEREFRFAPPRKFRFDFFIEGRIGVEVEGGTRFGKSRHSRGDGYVGDCRKYNLAAISGFKVLRYTTEMVQTGEAIDEIIAALGDCTGTASATCQSL